MGLLRVSGFVLLLNLGGGNVNNTYIRKDS